VADPSETVRRMLTQRRRWHELDDPPRRALLLQRPGALRLMRMRAGGLDAEGAVREVSEAVVDWRGFTEADLLGQAIGSSDAHPFSREVFECWIEDNVDSLEQAAVEYFELIRAYVDSKGGAEKNSSTS
jgi:hypothetical protein